MTVAFAKLLVWAFENDRIRWSEDDRYRNLAAYARAKEVVGTDDATGLHDRGHQWPRSDDGC